MAHPFTVYICRQNRNMLANKHDTRCIAPISLRRCHPWVVCSYPNITCTATLLPIHTFDHTLCAVCNTSDHCLSERSVTVRIPRIATVVVTRQLRFMQVQGGQHLYVFATIRKYMFPSLPAFGNSVARLPAHPTRL